MARKQKPVGNHHGNVLVQFRFPFWDGLWTFRVVDWSREAGSALRSERVVSVSDHPDPEEVYSTIHHELLEESLAMVGCEYKTFYPGAKTLFAMDHTQLHLVSAEVRAAYDYIRAAIIDHQSNCKAQNGKAKG